MPSPRRRKPMKQQAAFKRLKSLVDSQQPRDLVWYHRVGQEVERLCPSEHREYGHSKIESLAEALQQSKPFAQKLWHARRFFEAYERAEVTALAQPIEGSSFVLTWSHMIHLLSLDDADRSAFEEDCIEGEWSCKELLKRIQEYRGQQGSGGRRYQRPRNLVGGLRQLIAESQDWQRRFQEVWFHPDKPAINWDDKAARSAEVSELCREAVDVLEKMQHGIKMRLTEIREYSKKPRTKSRRKK